MPIPYKLIQFSTPVNTHDIYIVTNDLTNILFFHYLQIQF